MTAGGASTPSREGAQELMPSQVDRIDERASCQRDALLIQGTLQASQALSSLSPLWVTRAFLVLASSQPSSHTMTCPGLFPLRSLKGRPLKETPCIIDTLHILAPRVLPSHFAPGYQALLLQPRGSFQHIHLPSLLSSD